MVAVTITKKVAEVVEIEPGYYQDYGFFYYLNDEGALISVSGKSMRIYPKEDVCNAEEVARLVMYAPATKEQFYTAYENFRKTRSSILSK